MKILTRLARTVPNSLVDAKVVLEWHEGIQEVAGVIDSDPDPNRDCRAVSFTLKGAHKPSYLHPLSHLYEPLSYPLWYPTGGRGWSYDVTSETGAKVTQMWWYRQQVLRLPYMHDCGRLLNDWLINMFCHMEDERFHNLKREQSKHMAKRRDLCEVGRNETATSAASAKIFIFHQRLLVRLAISGNSEQTLSSWRAGKDLRRISSC